MDLDLRKLRYFVAVADKLHFGRAADELHIAQPALSRQIRALEKDLGALLLTRDSHRVALTDAGRQLLTDAGPLLASAQAVRRRVTVAAHGSLRLMVVNKNAAAQSTRVTLQDFKPTAAAQYQVVTDSLYGTGVTLNGGSLSSNTIGQGGAAIASVRAEACGDTIVKLPPYSVTLIIFAK